ncbi:MAG: hypothetical protein Q9175_006665 [Cornicularia normoerica]
MQIEGMIRSIDSSRCVGAVLSGGAHIIGSSEARVDGGLAACTGIRGVFDIALAGVVPFVDETSGGGCWACRGGGGGGELLDDKVETLVAEVVEYLLEALLGKMLEDDELDGEGVVLEIVLDSEEMLFEVLGNVVRLALEAPETVLVLGDIEAELREVVLHSANVVIFDAIDVNLALSVLKVVLGRDPAVRTSVSLLEGLIIGSVVYLAVSCSDAVIPGTTT